MADASYGAYGEPSDDMHRMQIVEKHLERVEELVDRQNTGPPASTSAPIYSGPVMPKNGLVCFILNTVDQAKAVNVDGGQMREGASIVTEPYSSALHEKWILINSLEHVNKGMANIYTVMSPHTFAYLGVKDEVYMPHRIKLINSAKPAFFVFEHVRKHESKDTHLFRIKVLDHRHNAVLSCLPGEDRSVWFLEIDDDNKHQLWEIEPFISDAARESLEGLPPAPAPAW